MGGSYAGTTDTLIASAKCQDSSHTAASGNSLCSYYKTHSIPHLMYGTADNMAAYGGGRDYASLLAFAKANLGQPSGEFNAAVVPSDMESCDMDSDSVV